MIEKNKNNKANNLNKTNLETEEKTPNWPNGLKKTKQRECVLSILENSDRPLNAIEIFSKISKDQPSSWLSTVYRILELFVKKEVVIKSNIIGNETAVYEINRYQHKHYAVCVNCHKLLTMNNCPLEKYIPNFNIDDFHILGHKLELYGYCKDCGSK